MIQELLHWAPSLNFASLVKYLQDLKRDVGMACQKVCKQGRDDVIVKV